MAGKSLQQTFGDVIRRRRRAAKISQEELARRAELHRTYISLLERGLRNPSLTVLDQLASGLGTDMNPLIRELERRRD